MSYLAVARSILRKCRDNKTIVICSGLLLLIAVVALIGPLLSPYHYADTDFDNPFASPSISIASP